VTLKLDEIVSLDGPPPNHGRRIRRSGTRAPYAPTRRDLLKGLLVGSAGLGLAVLGILPPARRVRADAPEGGWRIWDGCAGLGTWVNNDNCNGCNERLFCCCNSEGYHLGPASGCKYKFRPNTCKDGVYDGWTWQVADCCPVSGCGTGCTRSYRNRKWRCSDGYFRSTCSAAWVPSICRWVVSPGATCGCQCL
jgi:hypothetical protein